MMRSFRGLFFGGFYVVCFLSISSAFMFASENSELVLFDASTTARDKLVPQDITFEKSGGNLRITTGVKSPWPTLLIHGPWELKDYGSLVLELQNLEDSPVVIFCRVDMPGGDGSTGRGTLTRSVSLSPKESKSWGMEIPPPISKEFEGKFFAMRGDPFSMQAGSQTLFDRSLITEIRVFVSDPKKEHRFDLRCITAKIDGKVPPYADLPVDKFFPMIDKFGQFLHKSWPGKIKDEEDLKSRIKTELEDWKAHPGPKDWNQYGGWSGGPQLKASGHFRVEKLDGAWWLVDPEGRLFWSHGSDCVNSWEGSTPITEREFYFQGLPDSQSPLKIFYGTANWAPHNYYEGKGEFTTFNFRGVNLYRKYGEDWRKTFADISHKRLRSWGMNTIANWSDAEVYALRRTPYTATVGAWSPRIAGSSGYWGQFPDPFHEEFRNQYRKAIESHKARSAEDPWCIGYFIDNEISWGDSKSLSLAALCSPPEQPVKIEMLEWLKEKFEDSLGKLNAKWGTDHETWDAILNCTTPPDSAKAAEELEAFYAVIAEQYFKVLSEEMKSSAPDKLYLGCRFAWGNDAATKASEPYCDVISFNKYVYDLSSFQLPEGVDKPCIIGEFHFGALDRGMFHTGLCPTDSQADRAAAYEKYVLSALRNPLLVGTHWFQFGDQATTGRGDGENYQIGLIDICDTPYPETVQSVRKIGYDLYKIRRKN